MVQPAMDARDLGDLRSALAKAVPDLRPVDQPWRALFSRSGFQDSLIDLAKDPGERVLLFSPKEMYADQS